jgi:2-oxoglutarate ferredoxin oxidoreductase subunit alpha
MNRTFAVAIGGAAGQGVATPGNIFARIFVRRGLHLNAYNAYQSIIRGGHTLLTIRTGVDRVTTFGDKIDLLIPLNQDTMDRHLRHMGRGTAVVYNEDTIRPRDVPEGVQSCALPVKELTSNGRNKVAQNTLALGAALSMMGVGFEPLADVLTAQFKRKGDGVVAENLGVAQAGYDYSTANFKPFETPLPMTEKPRAMLTGNMALAMGGAAAGRG